MEKQVVLKMPGPDAPGYLRRARGLSAFGNLMSNPASVTPEDADRALDWLVSIVEEPKDKRKARALVLELSADQLAEIFQTLTPTPDPNS